MLCERVDVAFHHVFGQFGQVQVLSFELVGDPLDFGFGDGGVVAVEEFNQVLSDVIMNRLPQHSAELLPYVLRGEVVEHIHELASGEHPWPVL